MNTAAKVIFFCGKMAAGESTLARELADRGKPSSSYRTSSCKWIERAGSGSRREGLNSLLLRASHVIN